MPETIFCPADILLPKTGADMTRWSCVACDQFTSEPEYWEEAAQIVGDSPSTLRLMLPEIYLEKPDVGSRIETINRTMKNYLDSGLFEELPHSFVYCERTQANGAVRKGLIGAVDLEAYEYAKGAEPPIRATEGTVLERIPPRVRVRENASLELPHIMLLADDEKNALLGPLTANQNKFRKLYDFKLMQGGGSIKGWLVDAAGTETIRAALDNLAGQAKKQAGEAGPLVLAVGDGNHSLATAKRCYENLKQKIGAEAALRHPARYALVELVNLHDPALVFEPIHRVVFGTDPAALLKALEKAHDVSYSPAAGQKIGFVTASRRGELWIKDPSSQLAVGTLQNFLDKYLAENGGSVDYIHGDETTAALGAKPGNIGFLLPAMEKADLFKTVRLDGALPRKTFSMGNACDKRYYLECRKIR